MKPHLPDGVEYTAPDERLPTDQMQAVERLLSELRDLVIPSTGDILDIAESQEASMKVMEGWSADIVKDRWLELPLVYRAQFLIGDLCLKYRAAVDIERIKPVANDLH